MTRCQRWIEREEAADWCRQLEAEKAAEELKQQEVEEAAARKRVEVAKGKWPEVSLPQRGEGSGSGRGLTATSKGTVAKESYDSRIGVRDVC